MPPSNKGTIFEDSYADLSEGPKISIMRLRQLSRILQEDDESTLWPLALINTATCVEWFARTVLKHFIDYSADRINPDARVLRDLKINYALILQANVHRFSIGDIVATSRNFSSFDDIDSTLEDLVKETRPSLLARIRKSWADLMKEALQRRSVSKKEIARELNTMFQKRNELVHGTPRHLSYEDQLETLLSKRELLRFIHCALEYMKDVEASLRKFIPELSARSTRDNNHNQYTRLANSDRAIERLEKAIEHRITDDGDHLSDFRKAQRAWRLWRGRESAFQTAEWGHGSGRGAVLMGYETSFNMERLRSLEAYLRQLDRFETARSSFGIQPDK
ncbi:HEPN domain-containing protein [Bradyrhizobium sp.]|uniref:HEPN domain-containing protein n=1 Tax=Bradyrhizobium sp. TaxID=376 RepID=UPI002723BA5E|nr:HEPN domain-containing protein [Bradyrhizobium sp.]MDO9296366.1 HEPN domain-containing protein [Bradyrhizobium sp.]